MYKAILLGLVVILAFLIPLLSHASEMQATGSASAPISNDQEVVATIIGFGFLLVIYNISSLIVAIAARSKGYSVIVFFILAFTLTPLFGILVVIAFPVKKDSGISVGKGKKIII